MEGLSSTGKVKKQGRRETPEQRLSRLTRQREYNRRRQNAQTAGVGENDGDQRDSLIETDEHYERRLQRQREYGKRRRREKSSATGVDQDARTQANTYADSLGGGVNLSSGAPSTSTGSLETEEGYQVRLAHQRAYARRRRREHTPGDIAGAVTTTQDAPQSVLEEMPLREFDVSSQPALHFQDDAMSMITLTPVPADVVGQIEENLQAALGAEGLDECVCAVCDRLVLRRTCHRITADQGICASMQRVLEPPADLPELLRMQYDCSGIDSSLTGIMLSSRGVKSESGTVTLNTCNECHSSLVKAGGRLPKHAIANGFFVGLLPDHLFQATWIEKVMTQLATVVAQTRVMRGGRHRSIRSHCMVFDATPGPPATILPRRIDRDGPYRVVLAGPMTDKQTDRIRKLHHARGSVVRELLSFFKAHNRMYTGVSVDNAAIDGIETDTAVCERIFIGIDDPAASAAIDAEQESIATRTNFVGDEDECHVIEQNVLLAEEDTVSNSTFVQQRVVDLNGHEPSSTPRIRVDHSSRFASNIDIEAKMHAHLFPFGRGHPNEPRKVAVSRRDCMKYYAMLSSRRFAQDPTFLLTAFSRLSLENMYTMTAVKCRRYGSVFEGYESISRDELMEALVNNERRHRGEQRRVVSNPTAERFLKSVELGSVSVWGSSAERRQCRQEAFGYQTRFGQPSLFVTLTPNTDNSYAMAHYTGILSVDTLFDSLEARTPSSAEMKKAAMMDDCASARLFMRTVDAFITHVLGVDSSTHESMADGGRFGRTKAYYGMVETQGRGTLHIHFLVWLYGAPVNSTEFEERVAREGSMFMEGLRAYADSIVTNELPLPVDQARCRNCQAQGEFASLPISSKTRQSRPKRSVDKQLEPLLVKCSACGHEASAQHLIRQALLKHRPPHWPPPLRALSEQEILDRAEHESSARSSKTEAIAAVERRELFYAVVEQDSADEIAEWVLRISDSSQLGFVHGDDDPLKVDQMYRLIEMTPPTLDRARMSPEHYAYMLASLVTNLNMHAWTHTSSCFKISRATSSACICRYGFPRELIESSSLSGPSVKLKRTLGHEYINGFNATIMAMFKCNHDVQIMFGGKDAINRIYYVCKYVTKPQRQIDSATSVALASFQRRVAKEAVDMASDTPPSITDIRRRRVTGMAHTFTNKQEVAGPLAALYILRGSCCYSSAVCVKLPLSDILKQLESSGDYMCSLVQTHTSREAVFTSTSNLDDYIFRPQSTSGSSLYEFFMHCYRRGKTASVAASHHFAGRHPLSSSHCIAFRRKAAVPVIRGPRLIRRSEEMTRDELEAYAKVALVLFKPFRSLSDLLGAHERDGEPWHLAYCDWEESRSEFTKTVMNNMNDYHAGRDAESEAILQAGQDEEEESSDTDSDCDSSDDGCFSDDYADAGPGDDIDEDLSNVLHSLNDSGDTVEESQLRAFPSPIAFSSRIQGILQTFSDNRLVERMASTCANVTEEAYDVKQTVEQLRRWVADAKSDRRRENATQTISFNDDRPTTVTELIDDALSPQQCQWDPTAAVPTEVPLYSGIAIMSRLFTLNELQHGAFALIASHLLRRWKPTENGTATVISDEELKRRQLRMYLGGEGGTGKSRVIQAVQELCRCWQRPNSTVVCAMTGKAATIINGRTLASFEASLKGPSSHIELQDVDCLIIDEVSMMSKEQLVRLNKALNKAKRVKNAFFGGVHIILVGDFMQLPPVGADPLFVDPALKAKSTIAEHDGFQLWGTFDKVVVLRESVRFRDDPEWGEGCSKARYGEWTSAFVQIINSRVVPRGIIQETREHVVAPPPGTIFVSPDNDTRTAINGHFIARAAHQLPEGELPIRVVANFKGALNNLSSADVAFVMGLPDNKFGRMAPYLDLIRGMPVQVTQNIRTQKGVANGTMGSLEHVEFPPDTTFRRALDRRTSTVVLIPDRRPLFAVLRLHRGKNMTPLNEGADPSLFPVFPDAEPFKQSEIKLTPSSTGAKRSLLIKIQQFPFVCAVGATVYKVQGESFKSMVVVDWKVNTRGVNKPQQAYLMVSRVVKREGLVCIAPLTNEIIRWSRPPMEAIKEDRRLTDESDRTLAKFYAEQIGSH